MDISEYARELGRLSHEAQKRKAGSDEAYREIMSRKGKLGGWPKGRPRKAKDNMNVDKN
jgi:hypothetical protein